MPGIRVTTTRETNNINAVLVHEATIAGHGGLVSGAFEIFDPDYSIQNDEVPLMRRVAVQCALGEDATEDSQLEILVEGIKLVAVEGYVGHVITRVDIVA